MQYLLRLSPDSTPTFTPDHKLEKATTIYSFGDHPGYRPGNTGLSCHPAGHIADKVAEG